MKPCLHRRRFRACYRGKTKDRNGIYCADCGMKLTGEGRVSQRELAAVADLYRRTEQTPDASKDDFSLD